ncbi:MAG TPA: IS110 family transposase [Draconibacterium sp.]|nr:IS110 family transposase [Draconibacterium sp.]
MQAQVIKKIDFTGQILYVGLDVHKNSWHVTVLSENICLKSFSQPPSPLKLFTFLNENFPGASYRSAYEAGFCGYAYHRELNKLGVNNIVINPADIPKSNKDTHFKTDKRDSRVIAEALRSGLLTGIYVFDQEQEEFRSLFRSRLALAKDIRKTKGRIKSFLAYRTVDIPSEFIRNPRSLKYIEWLKSLEFGLQNPRFILDQLIDRMLYLLEQRRLLETSLRNYARNKDKALFRFLRLVPGIGPITSIGLMAELGSIDRFKHFKKLASYVGLVPRTHQSGESDGIGSITYRHNSYLRPLLIEASWQAVRTDPALLKYYLDKCRTMNPKKAIVKVARKLLCRIYFVMKQRTEYKRGIYS